MWRFRASSIDLRIEMTSSQTVVLNRANWGWVMSVDGAAISFVENLDKMWYPVF